MDVGLTTFYTTHIDASTLYSWKLIPYYSDTILNSTCPNATFYTASDLTISSYPYVADFDSSNGNFLAQSKFYDFNEVTKKATI